jgi:phosphatidate cytidylyltransferase
MSSGRRPGGGDRPSSGRGRAPEDRYGSERESERERRDRERADRESARASRSDRPASRSGRQSSGSGRRPPQNGKRSGRGGRGGGSGAGSGRGASRQRTRQRSDLLSRILVAVPAAVIAIIFVDLGGLAWALFMIAIGAVCMYELWGLLARWRPATAVGFASLAVMVIVARYGTVRGVMEVAVVTLPVAFLVVIARGQRGAATVSIAGTLLGVWWLGIAFAHAELLRRVPHGNGIIIDVMIGTFLGDAAAYFGGRLFGRRPLAPAISPNKTLEGLFCGMLIAVLAVFVAGLYQTWLTQGDAILLGLTVAVFGPIGDLFESVVKRDAGSKDSGGVFGAHGGALDRLDAVIFTIVAGYYVWLAVMH